MSEEVQGVSEGSLGPSMEEQVQEMTGGNVENVDTTPKEDWNVPKFPMPLIETHTVEFDPNRVRFLVYGDSGAGKTVFASSWPEPIFLDMDQGMASVKRQVARIGIASWQQLQEAYLFMAFSNHKYKTVVVDSLNEGQYQAMQNTIQTFSAIRRSYDNLPSVSDYGKALDDFDKFVRVMRGLPMNIVFISQLARRESEDDIYMPQFTGKNTAQNISRMMDCIGYLYKKESPDSVKPRVITFDDSSHLAKDRSGALPATIENPTYDILRSYWQPRNTAR